MLEIRERQHLWGFLGLVLFCCKDKGVRSV